MVLVLRATYSTAAVLNGIDGQTITPNIVCVGESLQVDIISAKTGSTICINDTLQVDVLEAKTGSTICINDTLQVDVLEAKTGSTICINDTLQVDVLEAKTGSTICINDTLQVDFIAPKTGSTLSINNLFWPISDGTNGQTIVTDGNGNLSFTTIGTSSSIDVLDVDVINSKSGSTICINDTLQVDVLEAKTGSTICINDTLQVDVINEKTTGASINIFTEGSGSVFVNLVEMQSGNIGLYNQEAYTTLISDSSLNTQLIIEGRDFSYNALSYRQDVEGRHRDFDLLSSETKITASDAAASDAFGISCDVDGETVVVGAHKNGSGSAYVFNRHPNSTWSQRQILVGTSSSTFGHEVAISGNFIIVGAPGSTSDQGKAFIFEAQSDGTWVEAQTLTASDGAIGDLFGSSVDISGFRAIVGAPGDDTSTGSAYIFERDSTGVWHQIQKVVASNAGTTDQFGFAVAISGSFAVVGAPREDTSGTDEGSVYIFERSSTGWPSTETQKIDASTLSGTITEVNFGSAVDIDNTYLIIGADAADTISTNGKAVIFERNAGGVWIEAAEFTSPGVDELFGDSVAIKGNYAVVGAPRFSSGDPEGRIYIYERSITGTWSQIQAFQGTDTVNFDNFGTAVGISGNYLVVGADADDDGGTNSGSAYIYEAALSEPAISANSINTNTLSAQTGTFTGSLTVNSNLTVGGNLTMNSGVMFSAENQTATDGGTIDNTPQTTFLTDSGISMTDGLVKWAARQTGATGSFSGFSVAVNNKGEIAFAGRYDNNSIALYDADGSIALVLLSLGSDSGFVAKYNCSGNVQWAARLSYVHQSGSHVGDIDINDDGQIVLTAGFNTSVSIYDSSNVLRKTLSLNGNTDQSIIQYDSDGNVKWATSIYTPTAQMLYPDISINNVGDIALIAQCDGSSGITAFDANTTTGINIGTSDVYVAKYNCGGNVEWLSRLVDSSFPATSTGYGVSINDGGHIIASGPFHGNLTIYNSNGTIRRTISASSTIRDEHFLIRYDAQGFAEWESHVSGTQDHFGGHVSMNNNNEAAFIMRSNNSTTIFRGPDNTIDTGINPLAVDNVFVAKYNCNGKLDWVTYCSATTVDDQSVHINDCGEIVLTGYYRNSDLSIRNAQFASVATLDNATAINYAFTIKYNTDGDVDWAARMTSTDNVTPWDIYLNDNGDIYVAGDYRDNLSIRNSADAITSTLAAPATVNSFLAKYSDRKSMTLTAPSTLGSQKTLFADGSYVVVSANVRDTDGSTKTKIHLKDGESIDMKWSTNNSQWIVSSSNGANLML